MCVHSCVVDACGTLYSERLWQKKISIIPVLIGILGAISKKFTMYVDLLDLQDVNFSISKHLLCVARTLLSVKE